MVTPKFLSTLQDKLKAVEICRRGDCSKTRTSTTQTMLCLHALREKQKVIWLHALQSCISKDSGVENFFGC